MGCQLKRILKFILIFVLLTACAKQDKQSGEQIEQRAWFNTDKQFSYRSSMGEIPFHPFFDASPKNKNYSENELNVFILTHRDSKFHYEFDLASGSPYLKRTFCPHKDSWARYSSKLETLPFNVGLVPRSLDQLAAPQKVYIFGNSPEGKVTDSVIYPVRVVGGVVEQYCRNFPCSLRDEWVSRLVYIAVFNDDDNFKSVVDLDGLKRKIDWSNARAVMENYLGAGHNEDKILPAYRVLNEVSLNNVLDFSSKNNHHFTANSAKALQKSCHALYDYIWNNASELYPDGKKTPSKKMQEKKIQDEKFEKDLPVASKLQGNVLMFEQKEKPSEVEKIMNKRFSNFSSFFRHFYNHHRSKYLTCEKFIQSSSITDNFERHWFFAYFLNYFHLEEVGLIYNCNNEAWIDNPLLQSGKRLYDNKKMLSSCSTESLDLAMIRGITAMTSRQRSGLSYYKYIEYDSGAGHSHEKIYRWIYESGKRLSCEDNKSQSIFPEDVNWQPFHKKSQLDKSGYIY